MKRGRKMNYRLSSIEKMFRMYQNENDRNNKEDAKITKSLITKELYRRLKTSLELLEEAETEEEARDIYIQFIIY